MELRIQLREQRKMYDQQLKKVAESHAKELGDLISQLDIVEAEHQDKVTKREIITKQGDQIITALSNQLSEALDKFKALEDASLASFTFTVDKQQTSSCRNKQRH